MSKRQSDISEAIARDLTNEYQNKRFLDEVGHKAIIQREVVDSGELHRQLQEVLKDIGKDIQRLGTSIPQGMQYVGSLSVHLYKAPMTGMVAYYSQLCIDGAEEALVGPAISDLRNAAIEYYRPGKAQRKRSGF